MNIAELETKTISELRDIARDLELSGYTTLKKQDLVFRLLQAQSLSTVCYLAALQWVVRGRIGTTCTGLGSPPDLTRIAPGNGKRCAP